MKRVFSLAALLFFSAGDVEGAYGEVTEEDSHSEIEEEFAVIRRSGREGVAILEGSAGEVEGEETEEDSGDL